MSTSARDFSAKRVTSTQATVLLHELLHYATQEGDQAIDQTYGITLQTGDTYSPAFTNWLAHDCQNTSN